MVKKKNKQKKRKTINALELILSRIPAPTASKRQRQKATQELYKDQEPLDYTDLC